MHELHDVTRLSLSFTPVLHLHAREASVARHQVETIVVLFSLKAPQKELFGGEQGLCQVLFPMQIYLNRGNHEDTTMNQKYGFQKAPHKLP